MRDVSQDTYALSSGKPAPFSSVLQCVNKYALSVDCKVPVSSLQHDSSSLLLYIMNEEYDAFDQLRWFLYLCGSI